MKLLKFIIIGFLFININACDNKEGKNKAGRGGDGDNTGQNKPGVKPGSPLSKALTICNGVHFFDFTKLINNSIKDPEFNNLRFN